MSEYFGKFTDDHICLVMFLAPITGGILGAFMVFSVKISLYNYVTLPVAFGLISAISVMLIFLSFAALDNFLKRRKEKARKAWLSRGN